MHEVSALCSIQHSSCSSCLMQPTQQRHKLCLTHHSRALRPTSPTQSYMCARHAPGLGAPVTRPSCHTTSPSQNKASANTGQLPSLPATQLQPTVMPARHGTLATPRSIPQYSWSRTCVAPSGVFLDNLALSAKVLHHLPTMHDVD